MGWGVDVLEGEDMEEAAFLASLSERPNVTSARSLMLQEDAVRIKSACREE